MSKPGDTGRDAFLDDMEDAPTVRMDGAELALLLWEESKQSGSGPRLDQTPSLARRTGPPTEPEDPSGLSWAPIVFAAGAVLLLATLLVAAIAALVALLI